MIRSEFNHKTGMLEASIVGEITITEMTEYLLSLGQNNSLPKRLKIFTDATKAWYEKNTNPEDIIKLSEANATAIAQRDFTFSAFVLSSAMETAMAQLYKESSQAINYKFKIFSTKESAIKWLSNF